jgi:hypothetical protein
VTISRSDDVRQRDYTPGFCWYGIKVGKKDTVPCNIDARLYTVERETEDAGFGFVTTPGKGPSMELWLCDNHKFSMMRDGFTLQLVR